MPFRSPACLVVLISIQQNRIPRPWNHNVLPIQVKCMLHVTAAHLLLSINNTSLNGLHLSLYANKYVMIFYFIWTRHELGSTDSRACPTGHRLMNAGISAVFLISLTLLAVIFSHKDKSVLIIELYNWLPNSLFVIQWIQKQSTDLWIY